VLDAETVFLDCVDRPSRRDVGQPPI
jgi:hypothetical protein